MPLALVLCGMTAVVLLALLLPLLHGWRAPAERRQFDRAVYRAQLDELARDISRGVINEAEAGAARLEIERRLLAADQGPGVTPDAPGPGVSGAGLPSPGVTGAGVPGPAASRSAMSGRVDPDPIASAPGVGPRTAASRQGSGRALAIAAALIIAGGAGLLYLRLGAPGIPDVPFAERHETSPARQAAQAEMADAAAALAAKLQADPKDTPSWLLYARTEASLGNWQTSADAYSHAIALGNNDTEVFAGYGEMLVLAADGIVGPPARTAFMSALRGDAKNPIARYYLALADAQAGEVPHAIATWQALAGDLPEDSPMREAIGRQIADAARTAGTTAPPLPKGQPAAAPAPTQDQMAAAANMPPAQREQMIRVMVAQLAARMASAPDNPDGWVRLGRAYSVLGETDKAVDAYDHAAKLKPGDVDISLQEVEAMLVNRKPDDAIPPRAVTLLTQIEAASPDRPEVLWYLGVIAIRNGNRDEARREWQRLLTLLPAESEDHKTVAEALQTLDKP